MKTLITEARQALARNFTPPARYGTAFHITLPFTDIREFPVPSSSPANWANLNREQQTFIASLDLSDVYLAWQLATGQGEVITVNEGQTQHLNLHGPGLYCIFLESGSKLYIEDEIHGQELAIRRLCIWQKEGSHLSFTGLRAQTTFLNEKLQVKLLGRQAQAEITHLTYSQDSQQYDLAVEAYHRAPEATSRLHVRSAANQKGRTIYRGLIDVDQAARGTNGYQSGRALLLSRQAVVDQLPQLAIRTNDVRCSHGVTTTHLDDQALFYLRSRGLPEATARQLAMTGFFHHHLDIPPKIRKSLEHVLA